ncbi:EF-Tu/IF-2/RF-3 family GTPase, partial [Salmonella sp. S090_02723]|uniref:EF-Tu/IF-2/RF-3 family GTPase n=1 Tax=Salmonella sp. S090_02723 TaxID=2665583 RepID=UPI0021D23584
GTLTFCRIYSGTATVGDWMLNPVKGEREKIGRMLLMHANSSEDIERAHTGDIVAFAGLEYTATGDTLCDPAKPIVLERLDVPEPVIEIVVEPRTEA